MNRADLIASIAASAELTPAQARRTLESILATIADELAHGHPVALDNFGLFDTRTLPPRRSQNPRTHQPIIAPAEVYAQFTGSAALREAIN